MLNIILDAPDIKEKEKFDCLINIHEKNLFSLINTKDKLYFMKKIWEFWQDESGKAYFSTIAASYLVHYVQETAFCLMHGKTAPSSTEPANLLISLVQFYQTDKITTSLENQLKNPSKNGLKTKIHKLLAGLLPNYKGKNSNITKTSAFIKKYAELFLSDYFFDKKGTDQHRDQAIYTREDNHHRAITYIFESLLFKDQNTILNFIDDIPNSFFLLYPKFILNKLGTMNTAECNIELFLLILQCFNEKMRDYPSEYYVHIFARRRYSGLNQLLTNITEKIGYHIKSAEITDATCNSLIIEYFKLIRNKETAPENKDCYNVWLTPPTLFDVTSISILETFCQCLIEGYIEPQEQNESINAQAFRENLTQYKDSTSLLSALIPELKSTILKILDPEKAALEASEKIDAINDILSSDGNAQRKHISIICQLHQSNGPHIFSTNTINTLKSYLKIYKAQSPKDDVCSETGGGIRLFKKPFPGSSEPIELLQRADTGEWVRADNGKAEETDDSPQP